MIGTTGFAWHLACWVVLGALPPQVVQCEKYRSCVAQARAPELVRVRVERMVFQPTMRCPGGQWRYARVSVTGKVLAVQRTATGLKPGQRVSFEYRLFQLCPRMVGPSNRPQPRLVRKGDVVWAFLKRAAGKGQRYDLAAGASSLVGKLPPYKTRKDWEAACVRQYPCRRP